MQIPSRRVRRLRVRAASDNEARHAATLLGDALRTASLKPADDGRLIVIRHLPLGRIPARASAASLALHIERIAAEVMADAVAYNVPASSAANAVMFANRAEAIVALAHLHAGCAPTPEWFWPEIVRGWRDATSRGARWMRLLEAAHGTPEAALVAAGVVDRAIAAGLEDELLAVVSSHQAIDWLRLDGWTDLAPAATAPAWRWPNGRRGEVVRRCSMSWDAGDARLVWLATLMSVIDWPACTADPRLPARAACALQLRAVRAHASAGDWRPPIDGAVVRGAEESITTADTPAAAPAPRPPVFDPPGAATDADPAWPAIEARARAVNILEQDVTSAATDQPKHLDAPQDLERFDDLTLSTSLSPAASTAYGGLLFVIPILERLEFAAFLAEHPALLESAFPARLLYAIGQRVGMPAADPLALACQTQFENAANPPAADESQISAWLIAVRRWCWRHPRIRLATLVRRPGSVHVSRTHIDTHFPLSQVDVCVRRWALDVDPGWVPWLGRVVTFTYGDEHDAG
jgi:hypothetical protein